MRDRVPVYLHAANPDIARRIFDETKTKVIKVGLDYSDDSWSIKKGYEPTRPYDLHMTNDQVDDVVNFFSPASARRWARDVEIALECHAHYDTETGIQICNQIEPYRPLWVEETGTQRQCRVHAAHPKQHAGADRGEARISIPATATGRIWRRRRSPSSSPTLHQDRRTVRGHEDRQHGGDLQHSGGAPWRVLASRHARHHPYHAA